MTWSNAILRAAALAAILLVSTVCEAQFYGPYQAPAPPSINPVPGFLPVAQQTELRQAVPQPLAPAMPNFMQASAYLLPETLGAPPPQVSNPSYLQPGAVAPMPSESVMFGATSAPIPIGTAAVAPQVALKTQTTEPSPSARSSPGSAAVVGFNAPRKFPASTKLPESTMAPVKLPPQALPGIPAPDYTISFAGAASGYR
ncbi:MAG TPA: hypothetical protein VG713_09575, partial [Pirellulales bacterium]|nr:hypothetical protein [Pirellulales bacterium]